MIYHGRASISDLLGEFIAFRSLCPMDARLRGTVPAQLGHPRKGTQPHATAVAQLLREAHRLLHDGGSRPPSRLLYLGDTAGSDLRTFAALCRITGWAGRAVIVAETPDPPQQSEEPIGGGRVTFANRWSALPEIVARIRQEDLETPDDALVVVDLDKTLIGARGRNSAAIDRARRRAADAVSASILRLPEQKVRFGDWLREFDQPTWHAVTADNQDAVVYVALVVAAGAVTQEELAGVRDDNDGLGQLLDVVDRKTDALSPSILELHRGIRARTAAGDPTLFPEFRRMEYRATCDAMACLPDSVSPERMLEEEIVITAEVWHAVDDLKQRGATVFGLSDKPDEACFPPEGSGSKAALPRAAMHIVGSE